MKVTGVVLDSNFANEVKVNRFKTNMKRTFIFKKTKIYKTQEQINMIHI